MVEQMRCVELYRESQKPSILEEASVLHNGVDTKLTDIPLSDFVRKNSKGKLVMAQAVQMKYHPDHCPHNNKILSEHCGKEFYSKLVEAVEKRAGNNNSEDTLSKCMHLLKDDWSMKHFNTHDYNRPDVQEHFNRHVNLEVDLDKIDSAVTMQRFRKDNCVKQYTKMHNSVYRDAGYDSLETEVVVMKAAGDLPEHCTLDMFM